MTVEIDPFKIQKVNVRSGVYVYLKSYSKQNNTSLTDTVETLIKFVYENNISLKELDLTKDKHLIRKYHDYTAAFLVEHEKKVKEYNSTSLKLFKQMVEKLNTSLKVELEPLFKVMINQILNNTQAILMSDGMLFKGNKDGEKFIKLNEEAINKIEDDH